MHRRKKAATSEEESDESKHEQDEEYDELDNEEGEEEGEYEEGEEEYEPEYKQDDPDTKPIKILEKPQPQPTKPPNREAKSTSLIVEDHPARVPKGKFFEHDDRNSAGGRGRGRRGGGPGRRGGRYSTRHFTRNDEEPDWDNPEAPDQSRPRPPYRREDFGPRGGDFGPRGGDFGPRGGDFGPRGGDFGSRREDFGARGGDFGPRGGDFGGRREDFGGRPESEKWEHDLYEQDQTHMRSRGDNRRRPERRLPKPEGTRNKEFEAEGEGDLGEGRGRGSRGRVPRERYRKKKKEYRRKDTQSADREQDFNKARTTPKRYPGRERGDYQPTEDAPKYVDSKPRGKQGFPPASSSAAPNPNASTPPYRQPRAPVEHTNPAPKPTGPKRYSTQREQFTGNEPSALSPDSPPFYSQSQQPAYYSPPIPSVPYSNPYPPVVMPPPYQPAPYPVPFVPQGYPPYPQYPVVMNPPIPPTNVVSPPYVPAPYYQPQPEWIYTENGEVFYPSLPATRSKKEKHFNVVPEETEGPDEKPKPPMQLKTTVSEFVPASAKPLNNNASEFVPASAKPLNNNAKEFVPSSIDFIPYDPKSSKYKNGRKVGSSPTPSGRGAKQAQQSQTTKTKQWIAKSKTPAMDGSDEPKSNY